MLRAYPKPELSEIEGVEDEVSGQQLLMQAGAVESELRAKAVGQDAAIEKLRAAYFDRELTVRLQPNMGGTRKRMPFSRTSGCGEDFYRAAVCFQIGISF